MASFDEAKLLHTTCGTLNYIAPEVIKNAGYEGHKADIWSCGVILYYMLAGCNIFIYVDLPFDDENLSKLIDKIVLAQFDFPSFFSADAKDLINNILASNPNKRLTLAQIKAHPWLKNAKIHGAPLSTENKSMQRASSKDLSDLNPNKYIPAKMDAFEFASYCTGKMLNGFFDIEDQTSRPDKTVEVELQTEFITKIGYKEYLNIVYFFSIIDLSCYGKN